MLFGNATGGVTTHPSPGVYGVDGTVAVADVNKDGFDDIALRSDSYLKVFFADGKRGWSERSAGLPPTLIQQGSPYALLLTDLTGDGEIDILTSELQLWSGDGNGIWNKQPLAIGVAWCHWLLAADVDNDGTAELGVATDQGLRMFRRGATNQ